MYMGDFWGTVVNRLTSDQVQAQYPEALAAGTEHDLASAEFAYDVIPNLGPGGATSDEDEEDLAERDPDEEITDADGPSLSGDKALMAYREDVDELYTWNDGTWLLWNY